MPDTFIVKFEINAVPEGNASRCCVCGRWRATNAFINNKKVLLGLAIDKASLSGSFMGTITYTEN